MNARTQLTIILLITLIYVCVVYYVLSVSLHYSTRNAHRPEGNGDFNESIQIRAIYETFQADRAESEIGIPHLNPFDQSVLPYYAKVYIKCPNPLPRLVDSKLDYLYIRHPRFMDMSKLTCCYRPYLHNKTSPRKFADTCTFFKVPTKLRHDFVKVECRRYNEVIYADYITLVPPVPSKASAGAGTQHINVIVLLIDGVSRMSFHRQMPNTLKYLRQLKAVDMKRFNKVGDNTFPNMVPLLTGLNVSELRRTCWSNSSVYFDACPFVWRDFDREGYVTTYLEDGGYLDTFYFEKKGFAHQPVDYYWKTFNTALEELKTQPINVKTPYTPACVANRPTHTLLLDHARKITERVTKERQKFFSVFFSSSVSHDSNSLLSSADDDFFKFVKNLADTDVLNNTLVLFLSDHGIRYGDIRKTYQGSVEANLPFLFVLAPNWLESGFKNLLVNSNRLVTTYDLYRTLKDLVGKEGSRSSGRSRGISLFDEIPKSRTCAEAGVPESFCVRRGGVSVSSKSYLVRQAADCVVKHLNDQLKLYRQCAELFLEKVVDARLIKANDFDQFRLQIETSPGTGLFEVTVGAEGKNFVVLGGVSRLTFYGREAFCVKDPTLKLYCYCKRHGA